MSLAGVYIRVDEAGSPGLAVTVGADHPPGLRRCVRWLRTHKRFAGRVTLATYLGAATPVEVERAGVTPADVEAFRGAWNGLVPRLYARGAA